MLWDVGDYGEISGRLTSCLYGHKPAFLSLCNTRDSLTQTIIAQHARRDLIVEFLPVVGSIVGFNSQLRDLWEFNHISSGWFDSEIGCDGNRSNRFVLRKMPYVYFRSLRKMQLIRLVQRARAGVSYPNAMVWDVLAILRSCRKRLPRKCAICLMSDCSWFCPQHDRFDRNAPRSYMMFFLDGPKLVIRNVGENDYVPENTLVFNYVASTGDLLV